MRASFGTASPDPTNSRSGTQLAAAVGRQDLALRVQDIRVLVDCRQALLAVEVRRDERGRGILVVDHHLGR